MRWLLPALVFSAGACGKTVPAGGVARGAEAPEEPRASVVSEAADLVPEDLDLVVRVDFSKVRDNLGEATAREILREAVTRSGADAVTQSALAAAEVVWLGTRLADAEAGDRVLAVHTSRPAKGEERALSPDAISWERSSTGVASVERFVARVPPRRDGTARIYLLGARDAVFVSPVEAQSVERVLRRGPDPRRGQPEARGLLSLDYRAGRLSPDHERRFPSLAALWRGIDRVRAALEVKGEGLELDGRILCRDAAAAEKLHRFLATIHEASARSERFAALFAGLTLERSGATIIVRWPMPASAIHLLLGDGALDEPPPGEDSDGETP